MKLQESLQAPSLLRRLQSVQADNDTTPSLKSRIVHKARTQRSQEQCLLLDVSGSMGGDCGNGRSKIEALKAIIRDFPQTRQFSFSADCIEAPPCSPEWNTDMARAFRVVKQTGVTHCVLITDGLPDSESAALLEAQGLKIDIIYVGPPPEPPFLSDLAHATGGQYGAGSLAQPKAIEQKVQQFLLLEAQ